MAGRHLTADIVKRVALSLLGVLLFVFGCTVTVFSTWFQDKLRLAFVERMNSQPGTKFEMERLRLWLPLRVELDGLCWQQDGDTMVAAGHLDARVNPLSLLAGRVDVERAILIGGAYNMGNIDSATMIRIYADTALLHPATVKLSPLDIHLKDGDLAGGNVYVYVNPNPPRTPKDTAAASPLNIKVDKLRLRRLQYRMRLMPTIDSLGVTIGYGTLTDASIDLLKQTVDVKSMRGTGLDAAYLVPDSAAIAATVVAPADTTTSAPWTVRVGDVYFDGSSGLYTTRGVKPLPGLDFAYISADNMTLNVRNFFNQATIVRLPLSLSGTERCGVSLTAAGTLDIDSLGLDFKKFSLKTQNKTSLSFDGYMGTGDLMTDPNLPLRLNLKGNLAVADARLMFPDFNVYMAPLSSGAQVSANIDVSGTSGNLALRNVSVAVPGVFNLDAEGDVENVFDPTRLAADVSLDGHIGDVRPWVEKFLSGSGVTVPPMHLSGHVSMYGENYSGNLEARAKDGTLSGKAMFNGHGQDYNLDLASHQFPVNAFMPTLGVGRVTMNLTGHGRGFNPSLATTYMDIDARIAGLEYNGEFYHDITGAVSLKDNHATADITSGAEGLDFNIKGTADFAPGEYTVDAALDVAGLDLHKLKITPESASVSTSMTLKGNFSPDFKNVAATLHLNYLDYEFPAGNMKLDQVTAHLNATDSVTNASVRNRDLFAYFSAPCGIDSLMGRAAQLTPVMDQMISSHSVDVEKLQHALPQFRIDVEGGSNNFITQMLKADNMGFRNISLLASNDSAIHLDGSVLGFHTSTFKLDTITADIIQSGPRLDFDFEVNNRPGTFDNWAHVCLKGFFEHDSLGMNFHQQNIRGVTGFQIGANLALRDSMAILRFSPLNPTIGYKPWTINKGNFIVYNFPHNHIDADLHMTGEKSKLAIYTEHAHERDQTLHGEDENLVVDISGIRIQDWVTINPFAPTMKGDLNANMRVNWHDKVLTADGYVELANFIYGKENVGTIKADVDVLTNPSGRTNADIALWVDGVKTMTLKGALNDSISSSPFNLDFSMIRFPLQTANAFLPGVARLGGALNGSLRVGGDSAAPTLDGWLQFDSATVIVDMLGTKFSLSDTRIPVENNLVEINGFSIMACNENPLTANGSVLLRPISNPHIDLRLKADNMEIVNASRAPKGASVYGKAFVGLDATAQGNLDLLIVNAALDILAGTNVTYVMTDAQNVIESQSTGDMVKFVNFSDSSAVAKADSIIPPSGTQLVLDASLDIQSGSTINVDLGGSDKVVLKTQGELNYTMSPLNSGRLTGRLNINGGFVRYTPPVMSQKTFNFEEGSYVAFSGDMLNPLLNIRAVDRVRANVTTQGQNSRLIYFEVGLDITNNLSHPNVQFDLSTDDDATVANELATMSPDQRQSTAMNLLITNMYSNGNTKADANLSGNALYSFLTSQLNSWAANNIRGVDISFGINQYENVRGGASSQATSYSYRVSKSLFNDRFKIIVGGNYSTDADADENLSQNLVNDISFEYLLNKQGTMTIRIFRHTGFESILEGEITQTGVGFVYRRKINRLADMFRFMRRRKENAPVLPETETPLLPSDTVKPDSLRLEPVK